MLLHVGGGPQALPRPRADTGVELGRCRPCAQPRLEGMRLPRPPAGGDLPVEEGGEEAAQENLVLHPRAQVAVHQLPTRDVDAGACGRWRETERPSSPGPGLLGPGQADRRCGGEAFPTLTAPLLQAWDPRTLQAVLAPSGALSPGGGRLGQTLPRGGPQTALRPSGERPWVWV